MSVCNSSVAIKVVQDPWLDMELWNQRRPQILSCTPWSVTAEDTLQPRQHKLCSKSMQQSKADYCNFLWYSNLRPALPILTHSLRLATAQKHTRLEREVPRQKQKHAWFAASLFPFPPVRDICMAKFWWDLEWCCMLVNHLIKKRYLQRGRTGKTIHTRSIGQNS